MQVSDNGPPPPRTVYGTLPPRGVADPRQKHSTAPPGTLNLPSNIGGISRMPPEPAAAAGLRTASGPGFRSTPPGAPAAQQTTAMATYYLPGPTQGLASTYAMAGGYSVGSSIADPSAATDRITASFFSNDYASDSAANFANSRQSSSATLYGGPPGNTGDASNAGQRTGFGTAASSPKLTVSPLRQGASGVSDSPKQPVRPFPGSDSSAQKPLPAIPPQRSSPATTLAFKSSPSPGQASSSSDPLIHRLPAVSQATLHRPSSHDSARKSSTPGSGTGGSGPSSAMPSPQQARRQFVSSQPSNPMPIVAPRQSNQVQHAGYQQSGSEFPSPVSASDKSYGGLAFAAPQHYQQSQPNYHGVNPQSAYKTPTSSAGSSSSEADHVQAPPPPVPKGPTASLAKAGSMPKLEDQPTPGGTLKRAMVPSGAAPRTTLGGYPTSSGAAAVSGPPSQPPPASKSNALSSYVASAMRKAGTVASNITGSGSASHGGKTGVFSGVLGHSGAGPKRPNEAALPPSLPPAQPPVPSMATALVMPPKPVAAPPSVSSYVSPLNSPYNLQAAAALQQQLSQQQLSQQQFSQQQAYMQHQNAQHLHFAQPPSFYANQHHQAPPKPYAYNNAQQILVGSAPYSPAQAARMVPAPTPSAAALEFSMYSETRESVYVREAPRNSQWPMTPEAVLTHLSHLLTMYERSEIINFPLIHFLGSATAEKIGSGRKRSQANQEINRPDPSSSDAGSSDPPDADGTYNHGYDDARGDYILTLNDHIYYRYEVTGLLGKGSFGQVVKAWDHKEGKEIAVKIIRNKRRFEKQGLVECRVLETLKREDMGDTANIIHLQDHFHFRGHLCITFELLGLNLYEWLKAGSFKGVGLHVIRRFSEQILQCLDLLSRKRIVHCDLKPENVLLKDTSHTHPSYADSNHPSSSAAQSADPNSGPNARQRVSSNWYAIKVIDFGSSCFEDEKVYTYVQSRFYRSPEVILGIPYNMAIDMWSLGCILAELHTGYPLFPGENEQEQLACIMEVKGVPDRELMEKGSRKKLFFDSSGAPRVFTNSKGKKRKPSTKSLPAVLRTSDPVFIDFIEKCLEWDPTKRMTPAQALAHDFVRGVSASVSSVASVGVATQPRPVTATATIPTQAPPRQLPTSVTVSTRLSQPGKALEEGRNPAGAYASYPATYGSPSQRPPPSAIRQQQTLSMNPAGSTNIPPSFGTYPGSGGGASSRTGTGQGGQGSASSSPRAPRTTSTLATGVRRTPGQGAQQQPWR